MSRIVERFRIMEHRTKTLGLSGTPSPSDETCSLQLWRRLCGWLVVLYLVTAWCPLYSAHDSSSSWLFVESTARFVSTELFVVSVWFFGGSFYMVIEFL